MISDSLHLMIQYISNTVHCTNELIQDELTLTQDMVNENIFQLDSQWKNYRRLVAEGNTVHNQVYYLLCK